MVQEYHPICKKEFYIEALKEFPEDKNVVVVSDTIDWCKEQDWLKGDRFYSLTHPMKSLVMVHLYLTLISVL